MKPIMARITRPRAALTAFLIITAVLLAVSACGPAPGISDGAGTGDGPAGPDPGGAGGGSAPDPGDDGDDGGSREEPGDGEETGGGGDGTIMWSLLSEDELTEKAAAWIEEHKEETGIFQNIFGHETLILINWGLKPNTGYSVTVTGVQENDDGELTMDIVLSEPADGDVNLPAETYPRAIISVEPAGAYTINPTFSGAAFFENLTFQIDEPAAFAVIGDSFRLKGRGRIFEAVFTVYLEDGHLELIRESVTAESSDDAVFDPDGWWMEFDVILELEETPTSPNGVLSVWVDSAKDGSPEDRINIPVRFAHWE